MSEPKYERRQVIDPSVAEILDSMQKKIANAQLPRKKREKLAKEKAKMDARRDFRVTYDLPPNLRQTISVLAETEGVPASQIVALALIRLLNDIDKKQISLEAFKEPSRSPRYDYNITLPVGPIFIENDRRKLENK